MNDGTWNSYPQKISGEKTWVDKVNIQVEIRERNTA